MTRLEEQARFYAGLTAEYADECMDPGESGMRTYAIAMIEMAQTLQELSQGDYEINRSPQEALKAIREVARLALVNSHWCAQ